MTLDEIVFSGSAEYQGNINLDRVHEITILKTKNTSNVNHESLS